MFDKEKAIAAIVARHDAEFPQESTGPAPPSSQAGTQRSRLNAYTHGLTGQIHLLTAAEQTAFDAHCKSICEALAPVGALEIDIAQAIAEDRWRFFKRARAIESGIFAAGQQGLLGFNPGVATTEDPAQLLLEDTLIQARIWLAKNDNFLLLALYEQRINRTIERNMAELRTPAGQTQSRPRSSARRSSASLPTRTEQRRKVRSGRRFPAPAPGN